MTERTWDLSPLSEALPEETAELLRQMGIEKPDISNLFHLQFADVVQGVLGLFRGALRTPALFVATALGILLLLSMFGAFGQRDGKMSDLRTFMGTLVLVTVCAAPLCSVVTVAVGAVETVSGLMCTLIPVLAAIIAAGGSPVLSVVWQTAVFAAAQTISALASGFMAPCCGMMMGTGILSSLVPGLPMGELCGKIRKACTWVFSAAATLFTGFLSLKGILAGSADSLTAKGIKLAVSSFVPVVGSQLSEAYSAVVGSLSVVRSTAGVFAIAAVCAVTLPAGVQILLWQCALKLAGMAATVLERKTEGKLFAAIDSALSVLHACLWFVTVLYVLSLGVILKVRAGG